jgi:hypothetical protein
MFFIPLETETVRHIQAGGRDAYGQPAETTVSDGQGNPCRHCLRQIPAGAGMLILAHRPFPGLQPYAETGPIFLCATGCDRSGGTDVPDILTTSPDYLLKGHGNDHRSYTVPARWWRSPICSGARRIC